MNDRVTAFVDAARTAHQLAFGLPRFLFHRPMAEKYRSTIQSRMEQRAENFLKLLENAVYPFPRSPYSQLLDQAGCGLEDVKKLVRADGLERALEKLREAGVYITLDEFKARRAARRGSQSYWFAEADFDNPRLRFHFEVTSGGTRSAGTRTMIDLDFIAAVAVDTSVLFDVHDLWRHEQAIWLPLGGTALIALMIYSRLGRTPARWFSQVDGRSSQLSFKYRAGTTLMLRYGRLLGRRWPQAEYLPLYGAEKVAAWIAAMRRRSKPVCVTTFASSAVRICCEAQRRGCDIRGAAFITIGEPLTKARRDLIEAAGATAVCRYAITEAGILGYACAEPRAADDVHFLSSNLALVQARRSVEQGANVNALYLTSLLPVAPKILINVESGDYGLVQEHECSCRFGALGYTTHIAGIRSFEKLTGEGVTFAGTDLAKIIDEVLPGQFGGTGIDYQVVEEEGADGLPRLYLLANPALGPIDEQSIIKCFLSELGKQSEAQKIMAEIWSQSAAIRVRRERPIGTRAGKVFPFHLAGGAAANLSESRSSS
jgi:hypothetical protein